MIYFCLINKIAGKDTLGKTVNNLAQMIGLVIFVLDYATAVLMKYVMDALVALVIFTSATFEIMFYCHKHLIQDKFIFLRKYLGLLFLVCFLVRNALPSFIHNN